MIMFIKCLDCDEQLSTYPSKQRIRCIKCYRIFKFVNKAPDNFCIDCGTKIKNTFSNGKKVLRCKNCFYKWFRGSNNPAYSCGKNYCIDCLVEIENRKAKRCHKCYSIWAVGINAPNYLHGLSNKPYPIEFKRIRNFIRLRDEFKCQLCQMTEQEHYLIYDLSLDVHHIDYDKQNNKSINLISLCKPCHVRTNYNREYWKEGLQTQMQLRKTK